MNFLCSYGLECYQALTLSIVIVTQKNRCRRCNQNHLLSSSRTTINMSLPVESSLLKIYIEEYIANDKDQIE